jgi:hypothetical protein
MLNLDTLEVIGYFIDATGDLENYNKNFNFMSLHKKLHKMRFKNIIKQLNIFFEYKIYIVEFKNMLLRYNYINIYKTNDIKVILKLTNDL